MKFEEIDFEELARVILQIMQEGAYGHDQLTLYFSATMKALDQFGIDNPRRPMILEVKRILGELGLDKEMKILDDKVRGKYLAQSIRKDLANGLIE